MIPWLGFERRWRDDLCEAALPGYEGVPTEQFWRRFHDTASPTFQLGLRAAVWALTMAPLLRLRRPRTFGRLPAAERDALLVRSVEHRTRLVRDLAGALRLAVCMAYFADPEVRARAGVGSGL